MPLHDWKDLEGWEGVHSYWLPELARSIKPQLPAGYRAYLGSIPGLTISSDGAKPDVAVRHWENGNGAEHVATAAPARGPSRHVVTFALDPDLAVLITYRGRLAAAIEIVSPRNKDRPSARQYYTGRYFGYLIRRASLILVDVHPRPAGFSFADSLATQLELSEEHLPSPMAIAFRDGGSVPDRGTMLDIWREPLTPGRPMPFMSLFLSATEHVQVDLEGTYTRAAADAYLT